MARNRNRPRRNSVFNLPGAFELFKPSKDLVLKNIWIFGPLYGVFFVFYLHSWLWSPLPHQTEHWWQHARDLSPGLAGSTLPFYGTFVVVGFSIIWLLLTLIVGTLVQIMAQSAQLDAVEHKHLDFQDLWHVARAQGWNLFKLYIAMTVAIVGTLFIFTRRYYLAPYVMLDNKTGVGEALKKSSSISGKNPGSVWAIIGVALFFGLISLVPYLGGLVAFALGCLYSIAPALRYQQLKQLSAQ